jgi:AcrR family transcriptional regulator
VDRRVRRTRDALTRAFIALVLERGYESIGIEDITDRADVARPTFYSHYTDKEALLTSLFSDLVTDLVTRLRAVPIEPTRLSQAVLRELFRHAAEMPDLYLVCLGGTGSARAREAYVTTVATAAETRFARRIRALGAVPRIPLPFVARAFAGAHTALLADWLQRGRPNPPDEMASVEAQLLAYGFAWAWGMDSEGVDLEAPTGADNMAAQVDLSGWTGRENSS